MSRNIWEDWQATCASLDEAISDLRSFGEDGTITYAGTREEKATTRTHARRLAELTQELIPYAIDLGVDEAALLALQPQLDQCATLVCIIPAAVENLHALEAARISCRQVELRSERTRPAPEDPMDEQRRRLAETTFCQDALRSLADTHSSAPGAWRKVSAFNGCGGQRWREAAPVKDRGKGYDFARHALGKMVDCGLIERAGPGKTKRGGFRITEVGLRVLRLVGQRPPAQESSR